MQKKDRKTNNYKKSNNYRRSNKYRRRRRHPIRNTLLFSAVLLLLYGGWEHYFNLDMNHTLDALFGLFSEQTQTTVESYSMETIPEYSGNPYVVINDNIPDFQEEDFTKEPFEAYSDLDELGRCGVTQAMLDRSLMPTEPRGEIGMVRPSGWHTAKYDILEDKFLFNRCHLIAFELTGENANEKNLITGTRYMNVMGMLPWENQVAQYIRRTNDKVYYRVTPVFQGRELVARGVHMEARSVKSKEIQFNIFVYNVQPGIEIDYYDGSSWLKKPS